MEHFGTIASLLAIVTLTSVAAGIGTTIVARLAAGFEAMGDGAKNRRLFALLQRSCLAFFLAIVAVAFAFRAPFSSFLQIDDPLLVELTAVLIGFITVSGVLRGLQQGTERFGSFATSFVIENVGRALLGIVGILVGKGIAGALFGQILAGAAAVAYTQFDLYRALPATALPLRVDFARLLKTSGGIAIAGLCLALLSYVDLVLAKHYLSPAEAGLYGFATLPGRMLSAVVSFIPTLILPKATARAAAGSRGHGVLFTGLGAAAAFAVPAIAIFGAFSVAIVTSVAGATYLGAAPLVLPYGCAMAVFSLMNIVVSYKIGHHRFAFLIPLVLATAGEVVGIAIFHRTAMEIVRIVLLANGVALIGSLGRVWRAPETG